MFHFDSSNIRLNRHDFPYRIWKVRTDPFSDLVALELRDPDHQTAGFAVIDLDMSAADTLPQVHAMDWWQGIEDFRAGMVLLHGYAERGVPIHEGLWAYDREGLLLWAAPDVRFEGMVADGLAVTMPLSGGEAVSVLNLVTGTPKLGFSDRLNADLRDGLAAYEETRVAALRFPELVPVGDARYAELCEKLGVKPFGAVNFCRSGNGLWQLAWHEGTPQAGFALALAVFREDDLLLDGWLEEKMTGMHPDPFFLSGKWLLSIAEQRNLVVVEVLGDEE